MFAFGMCRGIYWGQAVVGIAVSLWGLLCSVSRTEGCSPHRFEPS